MAAVSNTASDLNYMGTFADVARELGVTYQAVVKYEKAGVLRRNADKRINVGKAIELIKAYRDPDAQLKGLAGGAAVSEADPSSKALLTGASPLLRARTASETLNAKRKEIELRQLMGELIPREDAKRACFAVIAELKTRLDGLPSQVAPLAHAAASVPEAESVIRAAMRAVLVEVAKLGDALDG